MCHRTYIRLVLSMCGIVSKITNCREYGYPTHTIPADSPMFLVGKRLFLDLLREDLELPWWVSLSEDLGSIISVLMNV